MRLPTLAVLVLAACGPQPMTTTPPLPLPPPPPAPALTCLQTLQCAVDCGETDDACQNACLAKGSTPAQEQALALVACANGAACEDAACIQTSCAAELGACVGQSLPPPVPSEPLPPSSPAGSVPADRVGTWVGARYGQTERLVFNADGTGRWESSTTSQYYACLYIATTVRTGTVVVGAKTITLYATQVEDRIHDCTGPDEVTPKAAATFVMEWLPSSDPNELLLVDETCAARYPESRDCTEYAGCPIGLYCTSRLKRE